MRSALLFVLAVVFVGCSGLPERPEGRCPANVHNVWKLSSPLSKGSCAPISCEIQPDYSWEVVFLTAKHVVEGLEFVHWVASTPDGKLLEDGEVLAAHEKLDVALVRFKSLWKVDTFRFIPQDPKPGDPAWVIGYPLARYISVTKGYIGERFHVSAPIIFGNSGGPVLDSQGRIIGVISTVGIYRGQYILHMACFVPVLDAKSWIKEQLRT